MSLLAAGAGRRVHEIRFVWADVPLAARSASVQTPGLKREKQERHQSHRGRATRGIGLGLCHSD